MHGSSEQVDRWMVCGDWRYWRVPPGSHWDVTPSVWVKRGCSSTPPWTAVRSADVYRRRTTLDALGTPRAGRREEGGENEELGRRAVECSLALSVELLQTE